MLIILGGLPGTGKTTLARALATRLQAVHIRVDTIEQALRDADVLRADVGPAGYVVAYRVAEDNLKIGRTVIADTVNPVEITRAAWRSVAARAGTTAAEIEVICSDKVEHRRRVETRPSEINGLIRPTWQQVLDRDYAAWAQPRMIVDTVLRQADDIANDLIDKLGSM